MLKWGVLGATSKTYDGTFFAQRVIIYSYDFILVLSFLKS